MTLSRKASTSPRGVTKPLNFSHQGIPLPHSPLTLRRGFLIPSGSRGKEAGVRDLMLRNVSESIGKRTHQTLQQWMF